MAANAPISYPREEGIVSFDVAEEMQKCNGRKPWQAGTCSHTLLKTGDMRLVLTMMEKGGRMDRHHADGTLSVHVLRGTLRLRTESGETDLRAGQIVTVPPSMAHDVEALEPCAFLLTLSWPESDKLRSMPHRGYGS